MNILGISAWYHDSAACLVQDGVIVAAAQEERFSRRKHDESFPANAARYCLQEANLTPSDIDRVVFYDKPYLKFERLLETYLAFAPRGFRSFASSMPLWIKDKLFQKSNLLKELDHTFGGDIDWKSKLLFSEHHLSHAASAFYPSPFQNAAILSLDGVGEWTTTSLAIGAGNDLQIKKEILFPHSLGLLYSAFTYHAGFKVNSGEYKLMGLAPYGSPKYCDQIREHLVDVLDDGSFRLNMDYFNYCTGLTMTGPRFDELFGPPRTPEAELTSREMDLAASVQKVVEDILLKLGRNIANTTGEKNLCLAGGVALNCVANGLLVREEVFDNIWIQPAAGDAGGAVGAALAVHYIAHGAPRHVTGSKDQMRGAYLGPEFCDDEIEAALKAEGATFSQVDDDTMIEMTVDALANNLAVGWMQGRMEFGPRALGARSILANPKSPEMQKQLNLKVKYRESFRPFAPSVLREHLKDWFELDVDSPYMLLVAGVCEEKRIAMSSGHQDLFGLDLINIPKSLVPAVTHVDYSARIQTVHKDTNPRYHTLIEQFFQRTGCPMVVNTSFNVRGEPIVCTPRDAFRCFMGTELDVLVIGNYVLVKKDQDQALKLDYTVEYDLD